MKKIIKIDVSKVPDAGKRQIYIYRISSFSVDKISLEKHFVSIQNTFDKGELTAELTDETKVGIITQKVISTLIPVIIQAVDEIALGFESNEKAIISINFNGVQSVAQ
jgi:uncharacterized Fe-S cluster-containing MiaB family protein